MVLIFLFLQKTNLVIASHESSQIDLSNVTFVKSEMEPDRELEEAFSKVYHLKRGEDKVQYYYNRIDLNDDGTPETFVYLVGPTVCGTGGCSALIYQKVDDQYKLSSQFSLVRNPIIVQDKKTNGWRNIIMYVSGGGIKSSYKMLTFDGEKYPSNPSVQPDVENGVIEGTGIINDDLLIDKGISF